MKKLLRDYLTDILLMAGCGCILYGLAQWSPVITWIVGGGMLIGMGFMIGKVKAKSGPKTPRSTKEKSIE